MNLYKKTMVFAIIGLFIGAGVVPSITDANETFHAKGNTITVDNEGDGDYTSIQDAIDISQSGDTILVYSGTYNEHIVIDKQITIEGIPEELGAGEDIGNPIINGKESKEDIVTILSELVELRNFSIKNSGFDSDYEVYFAGIKIFSNFCKISKNEIFNNMAGIYLDSSTKENIIIENDIKSNIYGIFLINSSYNYFYGNNITSSEIIGIWIHSNSHNNKIIRNLFEDNWKGMLITTKSHKNNISENSFIQNKQLGISIGNSSNSKILYNYIQNSPTAIGILSGAYTENTIFYNNIILFGLIGIQLLQTDNCEITSNYFINCGMSLEIVLSPKNNIQQNNLGGLLNCHLINSLGNNWNRNFWTGHPTSFPPKFIVGMFYIMYPIKLLAIPYLNIDLLPQTRPYDIELPWK